MTEVSSILTFISGSIVTGTAIGLLNLNPCSCCPVLGVYRNMVQISLGVITVSETIQYFVGNSRVSTMLEHISTWCGVSFIPFWVFHWNLKRFLNFVQKYVFDVAKWFLYLLDKCLDILAWGYDLLKYCYKNCYVFRQMCRFVRWIISNFLEFVMEILIRMWKVVNPVMEITFQVFMCILAVGMVCSTMFYESILEPVWKVCKAIGGQIYMSSFRMAGFLF